jgi:uncharacterized protein (DUF885 family)
MDAILRREGYTEGSVGERMQQLNIEERFVYPNTPEGKAAVIADARAQIESINEALPQWFATETRHAVEVRPVPEYSQDSAPTGYYNPPAKDGSRPGVYWLNLRDTSVHPRFALPTLTYHESIPGHHLHFATAVDQDVPPLVTAIFRLVVDTGMHAKKWSREQAIEYMIDAEGVEEGTAVSEVERYAVWPGQALGYKLGMLKILELRDEAQQKLGDRFDIRAFNDTVLLVASTPLPYIEATVRDWIRQADM